MWQCPQLLERCTFPGRTIARLPVSGAPLHLCYSPANGANCFMLQLGADSNASQLQQLSL